MYSSDIWSLGCLLVELMTGNFLFEGKAWPELYVKLCLQKSVTYPLEEFISVVEVAGSKMCTLLQEILLNMLQPDISKRFTLFQLSKSLETTHDLLMKQSYERLQTTGLPITSSFITISKPDMTTNIDDDWEAPLTRRDTKAETARTEKSTARTPNTNRLNDSEYLNESVSIPCGLWDIGAGVLLECTCESPLESRESRLEIKHVSDMLYARIDDVEALSRNTRLEHVIKSVVERRIDQSQHEGSSNSTAQVDAFYSLKLTASQDLSVSALTKLYQDAMSRLDKGTIVIVNVEAMQDADTESVSADKINADFICCRKVLSSAVALAYGLANRDEIRSKHDDEEFMAEIKRLMPWVLEKCCKDLMIMLNNKIME
eukprot:CAMPEP_0182439602 /NCGR_PEP_ID=MMETSP1167-20130531/86537_1 /TAXON_ID=2988 /ORGANISM="Mallomonas Sp, Strain CCMP3275" /LENGTH=372 /DNA_ID=CAMNT_0024633339 /DNA_START=1306 /DNA_END=2424 /DNA_ORIENTATION=-